VLLLFEVLVSLFLLCHLLTYYYTLCLRKNAPTLKRYRSKLYRSILMKFGRNI